MFKRNVPLDAPQHLCLQYHFRSTGVELQTVLLTLLYRDTASRHEQTGRNCHCVCLLFFVQNSAPVFECPCMCMCGYTFKDIGERSLSNEDAILLAQSSEKKTRRVLQQNIKRKLGSWKENMLFANCQNFLAVLGTFFAIPPGTVLSEGGVICAPPQWEYLLR